MKIKVIAQCESCGGTGLYEGMCEKKGEPVVCMLCEGTGAQTLYYEPFTGRKNKRDIRCVRVSRGNFIATGVGGQKGTEITYEEFKNKYVPPPV